MAFIDDKGRLLGKINIIDLMVIIFVILIIAVGAKFVLVKPEPEYITAEVLVQNQPYEVISRITVGSQILDSSQIKIGEVLEMDTIPAGVNKDLRLYLNLSITGKNGRFYFQNNELIINNNLNLRIKNLKLDTTILSINHPHHEKINIVVEVLANNQPYEVAHGIEEGTLIMDGSQKKKIGKVLGIDTIPAGVNKNMRLYLNLLVVQEDGRFYFQNKELQTNGRLMLAIGNINLDTTIISINQPQSEETKAVIEVLFKNTNQWVAEAISSKDTELNHHGKIIAKITNTEKVPAVIVVTSDAGNVYEREHPLLKDVTAAFEIIAKKQGSSFLFHNKELKVGQGFTFYNENYIITGTIISRE